MQQFYSLPGGLASWKNGKDLFCRDNYFYSEDGVERYPVVNDVGIFLPQEVSSLVEQTAESFGYEWEKFRDIQPDYQKIGKDYFDLIDRPDIDDKLVLDCGCGIGRWTKFLVDNFKPRWLYCIDLSRAVFIAARHLKNSKNVSVFQGDIYRMPFKNEYFDFIYSLGVLHHLPDVDKAFNILSKKLKKGGKLLVYLYYALDNKPFYFKLFLKPIILLRRITIRLPKNILYIFSKIFVIVIYLPLIYLGKLLKKDLPLGYYKDKGLQVIFNDCFDRLSAPLEKRFTRSEILALFEKNGLKEVKISETMPYWKAIGVKY